MRKSLFLLSVFTLLIFAIINCGDTGANIDDSTGTTSPDTTQTDTTKTDTTQKNNQLVGEWYIIGSTSDSGIKVIFSDTTITMYDYCENYNNVLQLDNARYLLNNDTLEVFDFNVSVEFEIYVNSLKTPIIFYSNDTLEIEQFVPLTLSTTAFPSGKFSPITLYRSNKEEKEKINYIGIPFFIPIWLYSEGARDCLGCAGTDFNYDETAIIVNSNDDLRKYIRHYAKGMVNGFGEEDLLCGPEIDFSRHALLLASGRIDERVHSVIPRLQQLTIDKYKLDVDVVQYNSNFDWGLWSNRWCVALIINKPNEKSEVELNVILR